MKGQNGKGVNLMNMWAQMFGEANEANLSSQLPDRFGHQKTLILGTPDLLSFD